MWHPRTKVTRHACELAFTACRVLFILLPIFAFGQNAPSNSKYLALESTVSFHGPGWWDSYWIGAGIQSKRVFIGADCAFRTYGKKSTGVSLASRQFIFGSRLGTKVQPFITEKITFDNLPGAPFFSGRTVSSFHLTAMTGMKVMLFRGIHLIGETGGNIQWFHVEGIDHTFEHRPMIRPRACLGLGYTFQLRPYQGLRQYADTLPAVAMAPKRHTIMLQASHANYFLFQPSIEYRLQYAYHLKPRWDAYLGLEAATTRWFFPTRPGRDSVQPLGARLGMRFFPLGKLRRVAFYGDASLALSKRVNRYFLQIAPNTKNLQLELGCGLQVRILPSLNANMAFFHRTFWNFPGTGFRRERENGIVFGLGWQFGGRGI